MTEATALRMLGERDKSLVRALAEALEDWLKDPDGKFGALTKDDEDMIAGRYGPLGVVVEPLGAAMVQVFVAEREAHA